MAESVNLPEGFELDPTVLPEGFEPDNQGTQQDAHLPQTQEVPRMSRGEAAFTTATNPLDFGDEIKAALSAGVAKMFGGKATADIDIGDLYKEARDSERNKLQQAREQYPVQSLATGIVSDIGVAGKILKGVNLTGQGIKTAIKGGAVLGGTSSLGETKDITDLPQTVKDVATGVGVGGLTAGALTVAAPYAIKGAGALTQGAKSLTKKFFGMTPKSTETLQAFKEAGVSPTLANISEGKATKQFQNLIANTPGGKGIVERTVQNQVDDIAKQLSSITKSEGGSIQQAGKTIQEGAVNVKNALLKRIKSNYDELDKFIPNKISQSTSTIKRNEIIKKASGQLDAKESDLLNILYQYETASKDIKNLKPKRLLQFIKENGGIADYKGELRNLGINNKTLPGLLRKEGSKGVGIDDVGERLTEAGYFSERPSVNDVLQLINQEIKGKKVFLPSQDQARYDEALQLLDNIDRYGVDIPSIRLLSRSPNKEVIQNGLIPTKNLQTLSQDPYIQDVAVVGVGDTARVLNRYAQIIDENGNIPYSRLKIFRSTIGAKLQSPSLDGDERAAIKRIYAALSEDMKSAVVENGGEKGLQAFNKANNAFARYQNILESKINPLIKAKTPESVYLMAMSGTKQGGSNIRGVMRALDLEQKQFVRGTITKKMGMANAGQQDATGEVFSPNKFLTEWNKLSPEAKTNIYDTKQILAIDKLNKVISSLKETSKARQTSGSIPFATYLGLGTIAGSAGIPAAAATVGGVNLTARLITNPSFVNWLAKAPTVSAAQVPKHLSQLSAIAAANPEIRDEVLEFLESITIDNAQAQEPSMDELRQQFIKESGAAKYNPTDEELMRYKAARNKFPIKQ